MNFFGRQKVELFGPKKFNFFVRTLRVRDEVCAPTLYTAYHQTPTLKVPRVVGTVTVAPPIRGFHALRLGKKILSPPPPETSFGRKSLPALKRGEVSVENRAL